MLALYIMKKSRWIVIPLIFLVIIFNFIKIDGEREFYQKIVVLGNYLRYQLNFHKVAWRESTRWIAHAGGMWQQQKYTNSLEALNASYQQGFRLFELDLRLTSDGEIVAVHDWSSWSQQVAFVGVIPPSKDEFLHYGIGKNLTPLTMKQINDWFTKHPDAFLVSDKLDSPALLCRNFKFCQQRLYMELFSWKSFIQAKKQDVFAPMITGDVLFYANFPSVVKRYGVEFVAVSYRRFPHFLDRLEYLFKRRIKVFLFDLPADNRDVKPVLEHLIPPAYGAYLERYPHFKD